MTVELEQLALSEWPESAAVQVVSVTVSGERAEVVLLVEGYEYWEHFRRDASGAWTGTVSGNGPTWGWDDPTSIHPVVSPPSAWTLRCRRCTLAP